MLRFFVALSPIQKIIRRRNESCYLNSMKITLLNGRLVLVITYPVCICISFHFLDEGLMISAVFLKIEQFNCFLGYSRQYLCCICVIVDFLLDSSRMRFQMHFFLIMNWRNDWQTILQKQELERMASNLFSWFFFLVWHKWSLFRSKLKKLPILFHLNFFFNSRNLGFQLHILMISEKK